MRSLWITWENPKSSDSCPYKKRQRCREKRRPGEDGDRDCSYITTGQGTPQAPYETLAKDRPK